MVLDGMKLNQEDLHLAGAQFIIAANKLILQRKPRPQGGFRGLTGINDQICDYLYSVHVARAALIDAAKTASEACANLMDSSDELDAVIASKLPAGFGVPSPPAPPSPGGTN